MIIFNTSFHMAEEIETEFLDWARNTYLPELPGTGAFVAKILEAVQPGVAAYCIQTQCVSVDDAREWHDSRGDTLRSALTRRFGERLVFFTTYMEVIGR